MQPFQLPVPSIGFNLQARLVASLFLLLTSWTQAQHASLKTGPNADLGGIPLMPPDDEWNRDVSKDEVDPLSDAIIASIGADKPLHEDFGLVWKGAPGGIPYQVVGKDQPRVPITFEYADESDPGPYPIPPEAPVEGGPQADGDRHVLILDKDNWMLFELFRAFPVDGGRAWKASSGAVFDLKSPRPRPAGWTSADAAGLPILPGLARYDEICGAQRLTHALRFTVRKSRRAYVAPATHFASPHKDENLPPMGMRVRLKASFDTSGFKGPARVILEGLKTHGLILADNGGDWYISGAPDDRWKHEELLPIRKVKGRDLEVVKMGPLVTR
ncbi:MAG: hypothetical protein CJBNEKGG_02077 [Prosthecobacter sp.]|nr:hypothetical protein [Prosthecobacter sp.]